MRAKSDIWAGPERICWLCAFMEYFLKTDSLEYAPALLFGMASVHQAPMLSGIAQALFNFRQMSLSFSTIHSIRYAIHLYNEHHYVRQTRGSYNIDGQTLKFSRTNDLDPKRTAAIRFLSTPIPYSYHKKTMADPRRSMAIQIGGDNLAPPIPIAPILAPLASRNLHSLEKEPRGEIRIPIAKLQSIASELDKLDRTQPARRPGNWAERLASAELLAAHAGQGLRTADEMVLSGAKHLIGLPGSGKTTLLMLIAVWLGQNNYKTMLLFPSIEVARQYWSDLQFYGINAGMLVGQNPLTRRTHAERIAETIAASSPPAGFAHTVSGADLFALNCPLPAFATGETRGWGFGVAPCEAVLQEKDSPGSLSERLCPLWTMCGRNKAPRDLLSANIWVGHVLSMDTPVPAHSSDAQIRYFELIARTFDVVIFDEADMVQNVLDQYGTASMSISGSKESIHRVIQEQIHNRFASGENHRLFDRTIELYSRNLSEFGSHNYALFSAAQRLDEGVSRRFENRLLTTVTIITELLEGLEGKRSRRDDKSDEEVAALFARGRALADLWDNAAYTAFYDRTDVNNLSFPRANPCAKVLGISREDVDRLRLKLCAHFRKYLAEVHNHQRDSIIKEISRDFLEACFLNQQSPVLGHDAILLLVSITFVILGYQRIIPQTRTMVAEGLIREPILPATASQEMRRFIPENILGSLSGVKYSFAQARTTYQGARNVEVSYISFIGAPRLLMHRFHRLLTDDGGRSGPAVLMTSATSFLEPSPAYHVECGPHYMLRASTGKQQSEAILSSRYSFKWFPNPEKNDEPLRYSGAGELASRNLELIVDALVRGGEEKSEVYKAINYFDIRDGIRRKAAFVVNSYKQARDIKRFLDSRYPAIGQRTRAVVKSLESDEARSGYVTSAQVEPLGDDEMCDIIIFPLTAIGRGVNIVFTRGPRKRQAAIGTIYFLTRPHPTGDDMQLLNSLAGQASQQFDQFAFSINDNLKNISEEWQLHKSNTFRLIRRLLQEPLMASRLGAELFRPFTANQMVSILQTIGRGMRGNCPVSVYFVDAAWAFNSTRDKTDSARESMLVQIRSILEEAIQHPDPVKREIYRELYTPFLQPLREAKGVCFPDNLSCSTDTVYARDEFDSSDYLEEN